MEQENGKGEKMTREEALRKHRKMWTAMQRELGDNPSRAQRIKFKRAWTITRELETGEIRPQNDCYLCEYATQMADCFLWENTPEAKGMCGKYCPVIWNNMDCRCPCEHGEVTWDYSPISEILALKPRFQEATGENKT